MTRQSVFVLMYDNVPVRVFPGSIDEERQKELIDAHRAVISRELRQRNKDPMFAWFPMGPNENRTVKAQFREELQRRIDLENVHFRRVTWKDR